MTQTAQDVELYAGDDRDIIVTIYDDDGSPLNLSSLNAAQWVLKRNSRGDSEELLSKTLGSGMAITSASEGILTVTLDHDDTQGVAPSTYYHEIRIKNSGLRTGTVLTGTFVVLPTEEWFDEPD